MQRFSLANGPVALAFCVALNALVGGTAQAQVAEGQGTWTVKAPVPIGRTEVPGVTVNGKIYLLGGSARGVAYDMNRKDEYDPATVRWRGIPGRLYAGRLRSTVSVCLRAFRTVKS